MRGARKIYILPGSPSGRRQAVIRASVANWMTNLLIRIVQTFILESSREDQLPTEGTVTSDFEFGRAAGEVSEKLCQFQGIVEVDDAVHCGNMLTVT